MIYLAAVLNIVNGVLSFGSAGILKKILCMTMIIFGLAAVWAASRLNIPNVTSRYAAIVLSGILIVLRIVEFTVWHNIGFLLGVVLPIIVIWRLNSTEVRDWFVKL
ncbi:hypothetical protein [Paenibacillus riograndensis]|nr:hypothetical protein [Paenibacillus riograndensis]